MVAFVISIAMPDAAWTQDYVFSENGQRGDYTLRVNADLVVLSATVVNHHNALVSGLKQNNFRIFENHVPKNLLLQIFVFFSC